MDLVLSFIHNHYTLGENWVLAYGMYFCEGAHKVKDIVLNLTIIIVLFLLLLFYHI